MTDPTPYVYRKLTQRPVSEPTLTHRQLLGQRLVVNSLLRFAVAGVLVVGPWVAVSGDLLTRNAATLLSGMGLALGIFNVVFFINARRFVSPEESERAFDALLGSMYLANVLDFLALAGTVALLGGARSPFVAFYLLHVALGCIMMKRRAAIGFTTLAFVLVCLQTFAELYGIAPEPVFGLRPEPMTAVTAGSIIAVYGALFAVTDIMLISLVEWLRNDERALRRTNVQLDRLSQLRRDFLHVAVHNLRAPVGASRMHVENLLAGLGGPLTTKQQDWVLRIEQRLGGLQEMLQDLDILGELETEDLDAHAEDVDLAELARESVAEYDRQAEAVNVRFVVEADADAPKVRGIRRLLYEALANYVSNAVKYAPRSGDVTITVEPLDVEGAAWTRVDVRDHGPGIAPEHVGRLFREFSVPPRTPGQTERTRGSGLGLSIVRRITEAHGGRVGVDTGANEGSSFYMELPGA